MIEEADKTMCNCVENFNTLNRLDLVGTWRVCHWQLQGVGCLKSYKTIEDLAMSQSSVC